jgi:hypothetical protein
MLFLMAKSMAGLIIFHQLLLISIYSTMANNINNTWDATLAVEATGPAVLCG